MDAIIIDNINHPVHGMILDAHLLIRYMDKWRRVSHWSYTLKIFSQMTPLVSVTLHAISPYTIPREISEFIFYIYFYCQ